MTKATTNSGVAADSNTEAASQLTLEFQDQGDDAAAAFLSRWSDEDNESSSEAPEETEAPEEPEQQEAEQDEGEAEEAEETDDEDESDPEESEETDDETTDDKPKKQLDDDAVVKVKVDDEELEVSVKDLKRLYGQEAALTRKSQQVAAKRKEVEAEGIRLAASLEKMYQKAQEKWKPYAEIDMLVASKQLDADTFAALRREAQAAYEDFRFISEEAEAFVKQTQAQMQAQRLDAAREAVKVLKEAIPNWNSNLYDQIREYAITSGMDAELVNNIVDPVTIQVLHKARLYDESKKIATKKKVLTPKKVIKTTTTVSSKDVATDRVAKKQAAFKNTGTVDDAAELFMSRWAADD